MIPLDLCALCAFARGKCLPFFAMQSCKTLYGPYRLNGREKAQKTQNSSCYNLVIQRSQPGQGRNQKDFRTTEITGASLLGRFGSTIQRASLQFIDMPFAKLVLTLKLERNARKGSIARLKELTVLSILHIMIRRLRVRQDVGCVYECSVRGMNNEIYHYINPR